MISDRNATLHPETHINALQQLYREMDRQIAQLVRWHGTQLNCRSGCRTCCVDDLTVFEIEADHIRRHYRKLLEDEEPHTAGSCAFLDSEGGCRIYRHRPYVCRTQGLPLRWVEYPDAGDDEIIEFRDICPLNDRIRIEALPENACWTIGPMEGRLAVLQATHGGKPLRRVGLRQLFNRQEEPLPKP